MTLIQFPYQLSPAACDPVRPIFDIPYSPDDVITGFLGIPSNNESALSRQELWAFLGFGYHKGNDPQDFGIETFSSDTKEGGLPDDN